MGTKTTAPPLLLWSWNGYCFHVAKKKFYIASMKCFALLWIPVSFHTSGKLLVLESSPPLMTDLFRRPSHSCDYMMKLPGVLSAELLNVGTWCLACCWAALRGLFVSDRKSCGRKGLNIPFLFRSVDGISHNCSNVKTKMPWYPIKRVCWDHRGRKAN